MRNSIIRDLGNEDAPAKKEKKEMISDSRKSRRGLIPSSQVKKVFQENESDEMYETRLSSSFSCKLNIELNGFQRK